MLQNGMRIHPFIFPPKTKFFWFKNGEMLFMHNVIVILTETGNSYNFRLIKIILTQSFCFYSDLIAFIYSSFIFFIFTAMGIDCLRRCRHQRQSLNIQQSCSQFASLDQEWALQMRRVALFGIAVSTVCTVGAIVVVPMLYNYAQFVHSQLQVA